MDTIETNNVEIPRLGFGTFRMPGGDCQPVVESALALGYRHIDTAAMYENEDAVGRALASSGLARSDLFATTKAWHDQLGTKGTIRRAFETSLGELRLDFVDLYMIHWPSRDMDMAPVMEALTSLRDEGHTRAIGVCNFNIPMMRRAVDDICAPIAALQVEYHPFLDQYALLSWLTGPETDLEQQAAAYAAVNGSITKTTPTMVTAVMPPRSMTAVCATRSPRRDYVEGGKGVDAGVRLARC
jgi:2,5-diketo-D-gluconate reductase B